MKDGFECLSSTMLKMAFASFHLCHLCMTSSQVKWLNACLQLFGMFGLEQLWGEDILWGQHRRLAASAGAHFRFRFRGCAGCSSRPDLVSRLPGNKGTPLPPPLPQAKTLHAEWVHEGVGSGWMGASWWEWERKRSRCWSGSRVGSELKSAEREAAAPSTLILQLRPILKRK